MTHWTRWYRAFPVLTDVVCCLLHGRSWWVFNWLAPEDRFFGYQQDYYDGNIHLFGFWWFNAGAM